MLLQALLLGIALKRVSLPILSRSSPTETICSLSCDRCSVGYLLSLFLLQWRSAAIYPPSTNTLTRLFHQRLVLASCGEEIDRSRSSSADLLSPRAQASQKLFEHVLCVLFSSRLASVELDTLQHRMTGNLSHRDGARLRSPPRTCRTQHHKASSFPTRSYVHTAWFNRNTFLQRMQ